MPTFPEPSFTGARTPRSLAQPNQSHTHQHEPAPGRPWRSGNRRVESGLAQLGSRLDGLGVLHHGARSYAELHGAVPASRAAHAPR